MAKPTKISYSDSILQEIEHHLNRCGLPTLVGGKLSNTKPARRWMKLMDLHWKAAGMWKKCNRV